jgi:aldehyde:ferredoxin oxidoreductase
MQKIIRVDMQTLEVKEIKVPDELKNRGGRYVTSWLVSNQVPAACNPLGPDNKLIIAPGLLAGTSAPSSGRVSIGAKSPLTGGIKESNAGTPVAQALGRLGIKAIIVENTPKESDKTWVLCLDKDSIKIKEIKNLKMKSTSDTAEILKKQFGDKTKVICIGPAGDMRLSAAGVCFTDADGNSARYSGRGGMGAVMGSKNLKAIVINDEGLKNVEPLKRDLFKEGTKKFAAALSEHDVTKKGGSLNAYGTPGVVPVMSDSFYGFPTRNFSLGKWRASDVTSGQYEAELVKERGNGKMGHGCHTGCVIRCSNIYPHPDKLIASIEYESVGLLGSNCDIDNFDDIAMMVYLCNEAGLDTIDTGAAIGVAMEGGLLEFGDGKAAIELLKEVLKGTPVGRIIGSGAYITGKVFGVYRVPTVKKQALPAYDPRAVKGIGITYATSPMGADHTAGYTINGEVFGVGGKYDPLVTEGKAEYSRDIQVETAFIDQSGYCLFVTFASSDSESGMEGLLQSIEGFTGEIFTKEDLMSIGREIIDMELAFNKEAGFTKVDDRLPEFFYKETLPIVDQVFDVTDEQMSKTWE